MTIASDLTLINTTKGNIKTAIEAKGVTVGTVPFADYPSKIAAITTGGGGGISTPTEWTQEYYDSVKTLATTTATANNTWVRDQNWPTISAVAGDNKAIGLYAVWPTDSNFFAVTVAGAYTIDFGDGTVTNYASGTSANYNYSYSTPALSGSDAPVTFTASTSIVNRTAHGYTNGKIVQFYNIVTTTGITEGQIYYVVNATENTFQISSTIGGSAITLTGDGSATLLPYKIAVVTITPQGGSTITSLNYAVKHSQTGLQAYSTGWLDIAIACSTITSLTLGNTSTVNNLMIEQAKIIQLGNITSFNSLFLNCRRLQSVLISDTITSVTDTTSMFQACSSLVTVPLFNTALVTNMLNMFSSCVNLIDLPLFNTIKVTSMQQMVTVCSKLITIPAFNTVAVSNMIQMFNGCTSLITIPLLNTSLVNSMSNTFNACNNLTVMPLLNTSLVNTMINMFSSCSVLESVPLFNTAAVTNMQSMFSDCRRIKSVPLFNTAAVTTMNTMFQNCSMLKSVPLFNTAAVTNMQNMFNGCSTLDSVPLFNTILVNTMSTMFNGCINLNTVPLFNTVAVTNMQNMFNGCSELTSIPLFNTIAVTNFVQMFINCSNLQSVGALITTAATASSGFTGMFQNCVSLTRIQAKNFRFTFSVTGCKLSATALDEIYTNLPTVTGQTLTVTNNWGTATDTPSIATAKGWTITG